MVASRLCIRKYVYLPVMVVSLEKRSTKPLFSCHHSRSHLDILNKFILEFFMFFMWSCLGPWRMWQCLESPLWPLHLLLPHGCSGRAWSPPMVLRTFPSSHPSRNHCCFLWNGTGAQRRPLRGLCTCIPGQGIAMSTHAPGCQFHIPFRANLEGPSPLFTPDSSKKWVYTRVKFEIPLGSLLCDPWEARCLVELSYSSKSHWFGCWWEMGEATSGPHELLASGQAARHLWGFTLPATIPLQEEMWH